jgi:hypothetical protein
MAMAKVCEVPCSPVLIGVLKERSESACENCAKLSIELQKTLSELNSALTIIKLLQEDENLKHSECVWTNQQKPNQDVISERDNGKEGTWLLANSARHKRSSKPDSRYCQLFPRSENRYEVLRNLDEPKYVTQNLVSVNNKGSEVKRSEVPQKRKQNIVVVGDGHAKGCEAEIKYNFGRTFEVTGYVSPGKGLEVITDIARKEIDGLTKEDVVVIWGDANNIAKNESGKGLVHISKFIKQRNHTNIIVVSAPKRHDLLTRSCVNSEVITFNRKLHKRMKTQEHVKIIDSDMHRENFTRQGLHMNTVGKKIIA